MRPLLVMAFFTLSACGSGGGDRWYEPLVTNELRDPQSAQFSDVAVEGKTACGFVNSKNGYGGYAGNVPFVVVGDTATVMEDRKAGHSELAWNNCPEPAKAAISKWITDAVIADLKATE